MHLFIVLEQTRRLLGVNSGYFCVWQHINCQKWRSVSRQIYASSDIGRAKRRLGKWAKWGENGSVHCALVFDIAVVYSLAIGISYDSTQNVTPGYTGVRVIAGQRDFHIKIVGVTIACVTAARGRKNEALGSVCASAPNSVFYNLFRLFAISNACSD